MSVPPPAPRRARRLLQAASARIPYGLAARIQLAWFEFHRALGTSRFRRTLALVREILPPGHTDRDARRAAVGVLLFSHFTGWRLRTLDRCDPERLAGWVRLSGLGELDRLREAGQGAVLVNSQYGAGICVPLLLARSGYAVVSLEGAPHLRLAGIRDAALVTVLDISDEQTLRVRELQQARRVLMGGGFVHIAGDAYGGRSGLVLPFHGRARRFATSFASLAVLAGVPAIPVFATLEVDGRIRVEILPPLSPEPGGVRHEDRVVALVRSYARLLEARWSEAPGNVLAVQLDQYASLPRAGEHVITWPTS